MVDSKRGGGLTPSVDVVVVSGVEITLSVLVRFWDFTLSSTHEDVKKLGIVDVGNVEGVCNFIPAGKLNGTMRKTAARTFKVKQ